ncbi:MAG: MFS transporter [Gordonia sp. (in: high G+C Gram-positive bacteria)]
MQAIPLDSQQPVLPKVSSSPWRAAASGWVGSALEYYDWFMYGTAAALVFPRVFFPSDNAVVALIASLGTYAVGYIARPIGAAVLGHWGDRRGRKSVLVVAMIMMGLSTFGIALLPSYHQVGILAPMLLIGLRLIQGFAVAGELGGATAMIIEQAPFGRRGYFSSFSLQGTQAGQILAAAVFLPLSSWLPDEAFITWGWRIPFAISLLVVLAGYLIRRRVSESDTFVNTVHHTHARIPFAQLIRESGLNVLRAIVITLANVIGVTVSVFGAAYATQKGYGVGMSKTVYLWIPVVANVIAIAVIPFFGDLSDRIGRRPLLIVGSLGAGLLAFPYLYAIEHHNVILTVVLSILSWGLFYQMWNATFASFFQELFPARTRVSGFAVSQSVGLAISALTPTLFAAVAPPGTSHVPLIIGSLCFAITALAAIAAWSAKETHRVPLETLGTPEAQPVPNAQYEQIRASLR